MPAGWYTDPGQTGGKRWWDGAQWTSHVKAPEVVASKTGTPHANPYGISPVHTPGYVPVGNASPFGTESQETVRPSSNGVAWLSLLFGIAAVALTMIGTLPGPQALWICGAGAISVLFAGQAIIYRTRSGSTNLLAPIIGSLVALAAMATVVFGIPVISLVNSAAGDILPTSSTTAAAIAAPPASTEPFVFPSNAELTSDGVAVQQIATALNRAYAAGNSTLSAGQTWPDSLQFSATQVLAQSGVPLVTLPAGYFFKYIRSADQNSYSFSVTSGTRTEFAFYNSATDRFSFACQASDTNCVPTPSK